MFIYMESSQFFFTEHKITDDIVSVSFTVSILNSTFHPSTHGSSKENSLLEKKTKKTLEQRGKNEEKNPKRSHGGEILSSPRTDRQNHRIQKYKHKIINKKKY